MSDWNDAIEAAAHLAETGSFPIPIDRWATKKGLSAATAEAIANAIRALKRPEPASPPRNWPPPPSNWDPDVREEEAAAPAAVPQEPDADRIAEVVATIIQGELCADCGHLEREEHHGPYGCLWCGCRHPAACECAGCEDRRAPTPKTEGG